ncbi:MAG TPA: hypothetical protein VLC91_04025 [Spongiibacteraceae bacterium]|nr:hypothetical protein [Spongiibacteraceae bacterium]
MNIGAEIVLHHDLYFDPDDANASLYLCAPSGTPDSVVEPLIELLRQAALWSPAAQKVVPQAHKKNYAEQMQFIACAQFVIGSTRIVAARYDHPKFPSNAARWSAWLNVLATEHG